MAPSQSLPTSMPAWVFSSASGGLEANMKLNQLAPVPTLPSGPKSSTLIRVLSASLNPVDYKIAEMPVVGRFAISLPSTPGIDFAGRVWSTTDPDFKSGDIVFGKTAGPQKHGTLGAYTILTSGSIAKAPSNFDAISHIEELGAVGVCGLTMLQCFQAGGFKEENSGNGHAVFINGGSGGTGTFAVQIAKHCLGFSHVVTSCSGANADFVRGLGADEVLDYRSSTPITEALANWTKAHDGQAFDLIIDNVGADPQIYWKSEAYQAAKAKFVTVGAPSTMSTMLYFLQASLLPSFLGGGKRPWEFLLVKESKSGLELLGKWMAEGKLKTIVDSRFTMDEAPKAFERLKTGRSRGKIVVRVAEQ